MFNTLAGRCVFLGVTTAALSWATGIRAADTDVLQKTYTYKEVGDLQIKADVFRADDQVRRPVVLWIHGGALVMGSRTGISRRVKDRLIASGYAVVSIDYRLAPETKLPQIVQDVEDAYAWLHEKGPELFNVDTSKIVVMGGSAGGYLTLTCGYRVQTRPAALVAFWGYGDLIGSWYSEPSEFYRQQPLVEKKDAYAGVSGSPVTDGGKESRLRARFYLYCRQNGLWPQEVAGFDPRTQPQMFIPFMPARNVTEDYPPTLLIHGTNDTDVPYEQSVLMAQAFKNHGVEHQLVTVPHAGHGLADGDQALIDQAYDTAFEFVEKHVR